MTLERLLQAIGSPLPFECTRNNHVPGDLPPVSHPLITGVSPFLSRGSAPSMRAGNCVRGAEHAYVDCKSWSKTLQKSEGSDPSSVDKAMHIRSCQLPF